MLSKPIILLMLILSVVSIACGVTLNLPEDDIITGPTQTDEILVPFLDDPSEVADVKLSFAAGELNIDPGAEDALIDGEATYNVADLKPEVTVDGSEVRIESGDIEISGIPRFDDKFVNEWDIKIDDTPMDLEINAGAYKGRYEFGDLALKSLKIGDGAADVRLEFSEPNKIDMDVLRYNTGASSVRLEGLANANFDKLIFKGGAGEYILDFSGELQRDADVDIDVGISSVTIIVPDGVPARLYFDSGLSNVDVHGDWEKSGNDYILAGDGPRITINIDMGAGNLELRNR